MYCQHCGAKLRDGARFCENCGAEIQRADRSVGEAELNGTEEKTIPAASVGSSEKPKKRSTGKREEIKPPPFPMRVILVLCSLILICTTTATLFVNFIGVDAEATILSTEVSKQLPNEKNLFSWEVTYEFYANGKKYIDSCELTGPRGSINTFGYHVSYLAFAPEVSRLTRGTSVAGLNQLKDVLTVGSGAIFYFVIELFVSYFLLWVAFPKLPFFGIGKKKKRKKRKR